MLRKALGERVLIPGVVAHTTNVVEHPELVAQRLVRFAKLVGRENVMAGGDCGFSSQALYKTEVHDTVVWEKFKAMREGADIEACERAQDHQRGEALLPVVVWRAGHVVTPVDPEFVQVLAGGHLVGRRVRVGGRGGAGHRVGAAAGAHASARRACDG